MTVRRSAIRFLMSALFAVSLVGVSAAATDKAVEVTASSAPAGTDARIKRALSEAIRSEVSKPSLANKLRGYSILPALIQLQRVADAGQAEPSTLCVVQLSLHHSERGLVANIRGSASSLGATQLDTVYAAAHSAVDRLPETLSALRDRK